ncbi:MAG TPA: DUF6755 family protein [Anaeromyxobacteraceae bacterium]|nr:DUF6755 family protein [Anaeromyxobacteraceae bacterium]
MRTPRIADDPVRAWEGPVLTTALALGLVLMAIQLWLLTVALDLLLGGKSEGFLRLAAASGAVFAGGLLVLRLLSARPRMHDEG